jgi:hypothetical protein
MAVIYTLNERGMPVPLKVKDRDDVLHWAAGTLGQEAEVTSGLRGWPSLCICPRASWHSGRGQVYVVAKR